MDVITVTLNPCVDNTLWTDAPDGAIVAREQQSGGKGVNVARVLRALGVSCAAVAPVGDEGGALFSALAREEGVRLFPVPIAGQTRTVDTYVQKGDLMQKVIVGEAPGISAAEGEDLLRTVDSLLADARCLAICGSACCARAAALVPELIGRARAAGVKTLLDSNGEALLLGAGAKPDLMKPNQKELAFLAGRPLSTPEAEEDAARALLRGGVGGVLLSRGEAGAALVTQARIVYCPAPKINLVNAVGSGDSFVAAYLHAQLRGAREETCLAWANCAGAANAAMFPAARIQKKDIERLAGFSL